MFIAPALLAIRLAVPQGADVQAGAIMVEGKSIPLRLVTTPAPAIPDQYLAWRGFAYLGGQPGAVYSPYRAVYDWKPVSDAYAGAKDKQGSIWKTKIVLIARTETVARDSAGILEWNRDAVFAERIQSTLESIARVKAWFKAKFDGQVDVVPDVSVEYDILRDYTGEAVPFGSEFAKSYFGPRMNGGVYDAEDKVFRGPYNSAIYILPGYEEQPLAMQVVNMTPVTGVYLGSSRSAQYDSGQFEASLIGAIEAQIGWRVRSQGFTGPGAGAELPNPWTLASMVGIPPTPDLLDRLRKAQPLDLKPSNLSLPEVETWQTDGVDASIIQDDQRGPVLKFTEHKGARQGGIGLPIRTDGKPIALIAENPTLSFDVRSTHRNKLSIRIQGEGDKQFWVSIGRNPMLARPSGAAIASVPFEPNGMWQHEAIDLKALAATAGITQVVGLAIEPSPDAAMADLEGAGAGDYFFDAINLSAAPAAAPLAMPNASATSEDSIARALFAAHATATSTELIALLADKDAIVRLNATTAYEQIKDPAAEAALIANASDINPAIQESALRALSFQGTDAALAGIRDTLKFTPDEHAKSVAAQMLAKTGDKKYAGDVVLLFTTIGWQPKIEAVDAMTLLKEIDPKFRLAFLRNENPAVRLEVLRQADLKNPETIERLEWYAVNDPFDLLRATAYDQLIASGDPNLMTQGYAGVRDDSVCARVMVLDYMAAHPAETHRKALLLALTDHSPVVQAAALKAFSAMPGDVALAELDPVVAEENPDVQLALIALSRAKNLQLPNSTTDKMKASPDARVVQAIGSGS
jgi:HEAT repeat protein